MKPSQPIEATKIRIFTNSLLRSSKISPIKRWNFETHTRYFNSYEYDSYVIEVVSRIRNTSVVPRTREIFKTNQKRKTYTCHSRFSKHMRTDCDGIDSTKSFSIQTRYISPFFSDNLFFFSTLFEPLNYTHLSILLDPQDRIRITAPWELGKSCTLVVSNGASHSAFSSHFLPARSIVRRSLNEYRAFQRSNPRPYT